MKRDKEKLLLYVGVVVALLPILALRDFTPSNELRYLSIADEALQNGTFFAFTNHGVPYADKPPLYLWMVMLCRWIAGTHLMWLLALLSLLPAIGIAQVMDGWTRREMSADDRSSAQWMLLSCGLFIGTAVTLRMDMLMSFFIVLALREFWRILKEEKGAKGSRWLFPVYLFLALFTKGPLGILIPLCSTTAFLLLTRRIKTFFRYWGWRTWGVLVVCCALWFSAVYAEGGPEYLNNLVFHQTVGRTVNSFHHAAPFYYYAVSIWYSLAPWSLLVVGVTVAALCKRIAAGDMQKFFLCVCITTFILLSCISSKLQIYFLPAFPFFIYVTAMLLPRLRENGRLRLAVAIPAGVFAVALPALIVVAKQEKTAYLGEWPLYGAAAILTLCGIHALYLLYKKRTASITVAIRRIAAGMFVALFVGGCAMPKLNEYTGYGALCRKALEVAGKEGITDFRTWHLSRPESIDVYLHTPVSVIREKEPPASDSRPYLLLMRKRYLKDFPEHEAYTVGKYAVVVMPPACNP